MKTKFNLIILALITLALSACKKDNCCTVVPQGNYMSVQKNGIDWAVERSGAGFFQDTLYISGGVGPQTVFMNIKFTGKGKYTFTGRQSNCWVLGGDVASVVYNVNPATESVLEVTDYDAATKIISGKFTLNLLRDSHFDSPDSKYPQVLTFTKGLLKIKIDN